MDTYKGAKSLTGIVNHSYATVENSTNTKEVLIDFPIAVLLVSMLDYSSYLIDYNTLLSLASYPGCLVAWV